jgi:predicted kinase
VLVLLVGPKGSGKSHIGRILERNFGFLFFHVEPLWMSYYAECGAGGREPSIPEGIARVHPLIREALGTHQHVCVETTGASPEILNDLLSLEHPSNTFVVRVSAPLDVCLQRISTREKTHQIPMDVESIRMVHALSVATTLQPGLTLENAALSEDEIVSRFRNALTPSSSGSA